MTFDPSEFESSDEHVSEEIDLLTDDELNELSFSSLTVADDDHSEFWNDFDEVNADDLPY